MGACSDGGANPPASTMKLNLDFETRSPVNLKTCGAHVYAADPRTEIMCMAFSFGDETPLLWQPGEPLPESIADRVANLDEVRAWNAQFERLIWRHILGPCHGMPVPELEQYVCTMAEAAAMALPKALGQCAKVLNLPVQKDAEGRKLMLAMCAPQKDGTYRDSPEDRQRLGEYCQTDVVTERDVAQRLLRLPPGEVKVYHLDQQINDRGIRVDVPLVKAAQKAVAVAAEKSNCRLLELTDDEVEKATQPARIKTWAEGRMKDEGLNGWGLDDLTKNTVADTLAREDIPDDVREVMAIRQDNGRTSIGKLPKMISGLVGDRLMGLLGYHAASTGRWAGYRVQPHNFPRPVFDAQPYIQYLLGGDLDLIRIEQPLVETVSYMLRNMFIPSEGCRFLSGDYSQIEARIVNWLAGDTYRDHEYERMGGIIYGVPWQTIGKDSEKRQIGKNTTLGAGFGMGSEKFEDYCYKATGKRVDPILAKRAIEAYRDTKPKVKQSWADVEQAAKRAVMDPGSVHAVGVGVHVRYVVRGQFLWCLLPSGRRLAYALPQLKMRETPWGEMRPSLTFMGTTAYVKRWHRYNSYGGMLVENNVQALARDIMVHGMRNVEAGGYPIILTVHDEVLADTPEGHGSLDDFLTRLTSTPPWAAGCPVAAEGWEGLRWRK